MAALKMDSVAMDVNDTTTDAIRSLRSLSTVSEIVQSAPELVERMGFDRVILSELRDDVWTPLDVGISRDKPWANDILEAGRTQPQRLSPTLLETAMVRTRRPIHVVDVQGHPQVNRPIAMASKSTAYLAVPVVVGDAVGAFIHVDRYWSGRTFTSDDASQLTLFAEALGLTLERAHVVDKLAVLAAELGSLTAGSTVFGAPAARRPEPVGPTPLRVDLTPREHEVAQLLAGGLTNEQIATELVLSEATVKSHVKHILRKLNAGHRAEAVSKLIRAGLA